MEKIKLGIIGIGNMGNGHAYNIKAGHCPEVDLVAIADIDTDRLEWAKSINLPIAYRDAKYEMLKPTI